MEYLDSAFKYLGFYLNPNAYRKEEWNWLIKKVERRINNWALINLSLGGSLILVKAVIETISVN